jgi:tRNA(Ile2) C34 agmatinyltransferase TiaS
MAKGYPIRPEPDLLPECHACGSHLFREGHHALRCEDCGALMREPFALTS